MIYKVQISVVLLLFAIGLYMSKKIESSKRTRFILSCGVFISILFYIFYGMANYFTGAGITSAVIYYFSYGLSGAGFSEYRELILISTLAVLLGVVFSLWIFFKKTSSSKKSNEQLYLYIVFLFILSSLFFNPVTASLGEIVSSKTEKLDFNKNAEFYDYYKLPKITQIDKPKNLILIYAESLERTYFNETIFPNLTENLRKIESKSISFTNIKPAAFVSAM